MKERKKHFVGWITLTTKRYGGARYGVMSREALAVDYKVSLLVPGATLSRLFKPLAWAFTLFFENSRRDIWIRDDFFAALLPFRGKGKQIIVLYHYDPSGYPFLLQLVSRLLSPLFFFAIRKADVVLVISEYWKQFVEQKGGSNIVVIEPGLQLSDFTLTDEEVQEFRKRFGLADKPVVYIGNCQKAKGVVETYEALKELDVHLVTSGRKDCDILARNFDLSYRDYLRLLAASSVVVTMSKFNEGWCITAHEAMLCRTPVIGSGKGGMRELLERGGQIVCEDFGTLREHVESILNNSSFARDLGRRGRESVEEFSLEKFENQWRALIAEQIE